MEGILYHKKTIGNDFFAKSFILAAWRCQHVRVDESNLSERAYSRLAELRAVWKLAGRGRPLDNAIASRDISRRIFFRWQAAFSQRGTKGLESRAPAHCGRCSPAEGMELF